MKRIVVLSIIISFFSKLLAYEALLTPIKAESNYLKIMYEGKNNDDLYNNIQTLLSIIKTKEYIKLRDEKNEKLEDIQAQREVVESILEILETVISLADAKQAFKEKDLLEFTTIAAKQEYKLLQTDGIVIEKQNELTNSIVQSILKIIGKGGKLSAEMGELAYAEILLGTLKFANNVTAIVRVNLFNFYSQIDGIADKYVETYIENLKSGNKINIKYFFDNYYWENGKYYNLESFKAHFHRNPKFGNTIGEHLINSSNLVTGNYFDCQTTVECIKKYSSSIVSVPVDLYTTTLGKSIKTFKSAVEKKASKKIKLLGLDGDLFQLSVNDNFVDNSYSTKALVGRLTHNVSDLSKVSVVPFNNDNFATNIIVYCGMDTFENAKDLKNKLDLNMIKGTEQILYKQKKCIDGFGDEDYNMIAIVFNNKTYKLIDTFKLNKRYSNISENSKIYKIIRSLKIHGINIQDKKNFDINSYVSKKEAFSILYDMTSQLRMEYRNMKNEINFHNDEYSSNITYGQLMKTLDSILTFFNPDTYGTKNAPTFFPEKNFSITRKIYIKKARLKANKNYPKKYEVLKYLSKAGIIKYELSHVIENYDKPIKMKDFLLYINRTIEF